MDWFSFSFDTFIIVSFEFFFQVYRKFYLVTTVLSKRKISIKNHNGITALQIDCVLSITKLEKN